MGIQQFFVGHESYHKFHRGDHCSQNSAEDIWFRKGRYGICGNGDSETCRRS